MNFGKMLSFMSPAAGMATGQGLGKIMPYLSPGYGMLSGHGPFSKMGGMGPMGGILGMLGGGGHHGDEEQQGQPQMQAGMFGAPPPQSANPSMAQPQQGMGGMDPRMAQYMMQMRGY